MIKGINRQVIEISDPESIYYEKAWLVVRPEYVRIQQNILDKEAKKLMNNVSHPSSMGVKRNLGFWVLRLGASAVIGAGISTLIHCFIL